MATPPVLPTGANATALARLYSVRPVWSGVGCAAEAIGLPAMTLLHAGPPFRDVHRPSVPVLASAVLCCLHEGWAHDEAGAEAMLRDGRVTLRSAQDFAVVTPLAAVISPSTTLVQISDARALATPSTWSLLGSGHGPQLRFGTRNPAILPRLRWRDGRLREVFAALLDEAPIDLFDLAISGLEIGDDLHSSTTGATHALHAQLQRRLKDADDVLDMLAQTPLFFLTLWMGACQLMLNATVGCGARLVVGIAGNGEDIGVRLADAPGHWLIQPAPTPQGPRLLAGCASPMLGDSGVIDAAGFGAQAWSSALAVAQPMRPWLPGESSSAQAWQVGEHPLFSRFGLSSAVDAGAIDVSRGAPRVAIAMLDRDGQKGLLGRGVCMTSPASFGASSAVGPEINQSTAWEQFNEAFERYEHALTSNDLSTLDELFWHSPHTVRYGASEHLYGIDAIREFRQGRSAKGLERRIVERSLTTFGADFAVANMVFARDGKPYLGRQTQSWAKIAGHWRIVAAHVSWSDA